MLNCAEQVHIQKYKTHAYKTLKTAGVQIIIQTVGPKTGKDLFPKVSREKRGTVSNEVSRERSLVRFGDEVNALQHVSVSDSFFLYLCAALGFL